MTSGHWGTALTGVFNPANVANLLYWLDASNASTLDLTGSLVEEWRDRSSHGYEFWAAAPADRPTYATAAVHGLNAITWSANRLQSRTNLPGDVTRTYCWVMDPTDTTVVITIMSVGGVMVLKIMDDGRFHIANGNVVLFSVPVFGLHVWTAKFDGATSKVFKDGLQVWTGDAGTAGAATFRNDIGTDSFGGLPFLGTLAEMAVYSGVISETDRNAVEQYLYGKWAGGFPSAPRLDSATTGPATPTSTALAWTAGVGVGQLSDYVIEKSADGVTGWTVVTDTVSTATAYTVTGLTTGVLQYFRVAGINEVGAGAWSNVLSATTGTETVLDSFNRANGALGTDWNYDTGWTWAINSNQARHGANFQSDKMPRWSYDLGSSNMEASVYITHAGDSGASGPVARMTSNRYDATGYAAVLYGGGWGGVAGGRVGVGLSRFVGAVETVIATSVLVGTDNTEAMKVTIRVTGSTIEALVNDAVVCSTTDTTITSGTYAGFFINSNTLYQATFDWFNARAL